MWKLFTEKDMYDIAPQIAYVMTKKGMIFKNRLSSFTHIYRIMRVSPIASVWNAQGLVIFASSSSFSATPLVVERSNLSSGTYRRQSHATPVKSVVHSICFKM